jgi:hypothetical protein
MVFIFLSKTDSEIRKNIIEFVRLNIKFKNFNYKIQYFNQHIFENELTDIADDKDIILWEPIVAHNNLELVKQFQNSIVILEKPSLYIQKISKFNPINENTAINHGFYLTYINPDDKDITNDEWKLVVKEDMYLMTLEKLIALISSDLDNLKTEKINIPDVFDGIVEWTKNQINLTS